MFRGAVFSIGADSNPAPYLFISCCLRPHKLIRVESRKSGVDPIKYDSGNITCFHGCSFHDMKLMVTTVADIEVIY